jgi:hypothetical protein
MFLDLLEEVTVVQFDLPLRLPQPKKVNRPEHGDDNAGVKSIAKSHVERSAYASKLASDSD